MSKALISLNKVTKRYGHRTVLSNISLQIQRGESITIMGGNGSGKSTFLRIVSGLIPVTSGERMMESSKLMLGYVPDRMPKLKMTSTEYLMHMGRIAHIPKAELLARIGELHDRYQLEQSTTKMIHFSKGMLQKVNIMQATLRMPDLLVLDEPFSGLDKPSIELLSSSLASIQAQGTSIVSAIHDPMLTRQLHSRMLWLHQGLLRSASEIDEEELQIVLFELTCRLTSDLLVQVTHLFPEAIVLKGDAELITFTIKQQDYQGFMMELLKNGVEIISLQRKEIR